MKIRLFNAIATFGLIIACLASPATAAPDAAANKALIQSLYSQAYNAHDLSKLEQFFAPDFIHRDVRGDVGLVAVKTNFGPVFGAFSDWTARIEQTLVEGDRVLVFVTWSGTHDGTLNGYPAT
ncbi:MAG: ester cyclase, partial [Lysobacteraceae bacterium]